MLKIRATVEPRPTAHMLCGSPPDGTPLSDLSDIHQRIDHLSSMTTDVTTDEGALTLRVATSNHFAMSMLRQTLAGQ